jgi:polyhydroxybutyrate depolymerase
VGGHRDVPVADLPDRFSSMPTQFARRATYLVLGALLIGGLQLGAGAVGAQGSGVAPHVLPPGDHTYSLTVGHVTRTFVLHVPTYNTAVNRPLLLIYHGAGGTSQSTENQTDFSKVADTTGEVVAYLQGVNNHWNEQVAGAPSTADDVGYTRAAITLIERLISFDHKRIVAVGFSNGALMVEDLGCKLAGTLALIVPVEGELAAATSPTCKPSRPIRVYEIHGTADTEISYNGGKIAGHPVVVLSAPKSVARWARLDRCAATPKIGPVVSGVKLTTYSHCRNKVGVVLRTLIGGVHQWTPKIGEIVAGVLPPA